MISSDLLKLNRFVSVGKLIHCYRNMHELIDIVNPNTIRNIGILAHIDAGKTTTTERLLYYSGKIKSMGEVHKGTTVTDFMTQERHRGITITSACVSFEWNNHLFNLVDTPGHIDFTVEVEQALNVMDSAVIVLDASAGVEAQTITVWKQAEEKKLPFIVYANKMDRADSDILNCKMSLEEKLGVTPLILQVPLIDKSRFYGVVDLVSMKKISWLNNNILYDDLKKTDNDYNTSLDKRNILIDHLSSLDNDIADIVLNAGCFEAVSENELKASIRKITISKKGVPVVCGSSYKNIGIETLLDSIINYLPSPLESIDHSIFHQFSNGLIGKSFKIMHDKQRGPLSFFRIYCGKLEKGQKIYNLHKNKADKASFLFTAFANELKEVSSAKQGSFIAISGLKTVKIGDVICSSEAAANKLKDLEFKNNHCSEKLLQRCTLPKPVVFCSVEAPSQYYQQSLDKALSELSLEDPGLSVTYCHETGQTILGGMGELHLEIIKERIKSEYKMDVEIGPLQIIYKEKPLSNVMKTHSVRSTVGPREHNIEISLSLMSETFPQLLRLDTSKEANQNLSLITPKILTALKYGVTSGFSNGPSMSCEVIDCHVTIHSLIMKRSVPDSLIIAATSQCITKMLKEAGTQLLEPIMEVIILIEDDYLSKVLGDLSRRRANILNIISKNRVKEIFSEVPLSELRGYAKRLRTITSGTARLTMEFTYYKGVLPEIQDKIINGII